MYLKIIPGEEKEKDIHKSRSKRVKYILIIHIYENTNKGLKKSRDIRYKTEKKIQ